jgi:hypothetical protein
MLWRGALGALLAGCAALHGQSPYRGPSAGVAPVLVRSLTRQWADPFYGWQVQPIVLVTNTQPTFRAVVKLSCYPDEVDVSPRTTQAVLVTDNRLCEVLSMRLVPQVAGQP